MIDSTIVLAPSTPQARARSKGAKPRAWPVSRRPEHQIHAHRALGLPVRLIASPASANDIAFAHDLIDASRPGPPSPTRLRRRSPRRKDRRGRRRSRHPRPSATAGSSATTTPTSTRRNRIERSTHAQAVRRVATRYDKLFANFMGFVKLAQSLSGSNSKTSLRPRTL